MAGRPRDPAVDRRILDAAVATFAEMGWSGFSVESVARRARVGKASVYLRWEHREDLLTEAVASAFVPIGAIDTGSLRDDLAALARTLLALYAGPHGTAARRMVVESQATPGVSERWAHVRQGQVRAAREIVRRGVARGELPHDTSVALVLDTLCGAAMLHPVASPEESETARAAYADRLVDLVLTGARHTSGATSRTTPAGRRGGAHAK